MVCEENSQRGTFRLSEHFGVNTSRAVGDAMLLSVVVLLLMNIVLVIIRNRRP